ncbi:MAG TPA: chaperone modulator CbpM [Woeseiaceae bacterium]|nr:chaperone modulator CbpM [Woeseiaceae bacterium]
MNERIQDELSGVVLDERVTFTLSEFCLACGVQRELVIEMVEEGVIEPAGRDESGWIFYGASVVRARTALRLVRDLEVNWPGAALALDLLEELGRLHGR